MDRGKTCALAPSVAEGYRGEGLGSAVMQYAIAGARLKAMTAMILMGGVQARNLPAMAFYLKHGFRKVGQFDSNGMSNYDMMLEL